MSFQSVKWFYLYVTTSNIATLIHDERAIRNEASYPSNELSVCQMVLFVRNHSEAENHLLTYGEESS
jgi:hypothetical protein